MLRSSFELARTSIISGFSMPAVMRKRPRSSLATSLTISFWREMTVERWSYRDRRVGREGRGEEEVMDTTREENERKYDSGRDERGRREDKC